MTSAFVARPARRLALPEALVRRAIDEAHRVPTTSPLSFFARSIGAITLRRQRRREVLERVEPQHAPRSAARTPSPRCPEQR